MGGLSIDKTIGSLKASFVQLWPICNYLILFAFYDVGEEKHTGVRTTELNTED